MPVIIAAVIALPVLVLAGEIQLVRRGPDVPTPDVATLATVVRQPDSASDRVVRILWMGDSTAAGVGASSPEHAVSTQVAQRLVADGSHHTFDVSVIAHSGDRIKDVVNDQLPQVDALTPDVVVISVGANDTIHLTRTPTFRKTYGRLIDGLLRERIAADHIVLVGVPDMGATHRLLQPLRAITGLRSRRLDRAVKGIAAETGVRYVDLFKATSTEFRAHTKTYFAKDNYHPSDAGYAKWADAITPAVTKAVG